MLTKEAILAAEREAVFASHDEDLAYIARAMFDMGQEEMRERIATWHADTGWLLDEQDVPDAIRALPLLEKQQ